MSALHACQGEARLAPGRPAPLHLRPDIQAKARPRCVSLLQLIDLILTIYMWIIIAVVILSWLVAFNIINRQNDIVRQISYALYRLTEPVLGPIRRLLPDLGGLDLSPIDRAHRDLVPPQPRCGNTARGSWALSLLPWRPSATGCCFPCA